jgi:LemA protein
MIILLIILGVLFIIAVYLYNSLIAKKNNVDKSFASVDVLLKKRYDLLPNLVESVKVYMNYEKDLLTKITDLRTRAISQGLTDAERMQIENEMTRQLSGLKVAVENYPDLKANQNFLQLQGSWNEVEEQVSASRRAFNAAVMDYNNGVQMFPSNLIAYLMNYTTKTMFELPEMERQNISAKQLFNS